MKNPRKDSLVVEVSIGSDQEESAKQAIRTFTKKVRNSGLIQELLMRKHYEKPSEKRKRKSRLSQVKVNDDNND